MLTISRPRPALQAPASCLWRPCWQVLQRQQQVLLCCLPPQWLRKHLCCPLPCCPLLKHLCCPSCWHPCRQQCCRLLRRRHLWLCHPLLLGALCQPSALHRHRRQGALMCHPDPTSRASSRWACLLQRSLTMPGRQAACCRPLTWLGSPAVQHSSVPALPPPAMHAAAVMFSACVLKIPAAIADCTSHDRAIFDESG